MQDLMIYNVTSCNVCAHSLYRGLNPDYLELSSSSLSVVRDAREFNFLQEYSTSGGNNLRCTSIRIMELHCEHDKMLLSAEVCETTLPRERKLYHVPRYGSHSSATTAYSVMSFHLAITETYR